MRDCLDQLLTLFHNCILIYNGLFHHIDELLIVCVHLQKRVIHIDFAQQCVDLVFVHWFIERWGLNWRGFVVRIISSQLGSGKVSNACNSGKTGVISVTGLVQLTQIKTTSVPHFCLIFIDFLICSRVHTCVEHASIHGCIEGFSSKTGTETSGIANVVSFFAF